MKNNTIALKPYLEAVENICRSLSKEQLIELILNMAQDESSSGRLGFLDRIKTRRPGAERSINPVAGVDQLLADIQALKEDILKRIENIENGEYEGLDDWDWEDHDYYDDEPEFISDEQSDEMAELFAKADDLFLNGDTGKARIVYDALFGLMAELERSDFYLPYPDLDWREERARHARCVYDNSEGKQRVKDFTNAMDLEASYRHNRMENNAAYPMLCDVIDARQEKMEDLESFYPEWKSLLEKKGLEGRPSSLLLETVHHTEGIKGVETLARSWGSAQPNGYLFWLDLLMVEKKFDKACTIARQAIKLVKKGKKREAVSQMLVEASRSAGNDAGILEGKFEKFYSRPNDENMAQAMTEAIELNQRETGLTWLLDFYAGKKRMSDDEKNLYMKALLMNGNLKAAVEMVQTAKSLGWSYGLNVSLVFGCVAAAASEFETAAGAIKQVLDRSLHNWQAYSDKFVIPEEITTPLFFYNEILNGLKAANLSEYHTQQNFKWAQKIGKKRVDDIVSNTHRGAYDRAAMVLGSIAEVYTAKGETKTAQDLFHEFCKQKYNRHTAFKREVRSIIDGSRLLKTLNPVF
nr:hypothetical protein [uncultured Desulfobacter sp.]